MLLREQCLRKYQKIIEKLTKKLMDMQKKNQKLNEEVVTDALIVRYQKIIEKRFMYEYLTLKSLEQCYEEEAYGSIGTYFHVVIQIQKKQFVEKFFSPFVYIMSFLDNIGMIITHPDKKADKYTLRIIDAAVRLCFSIDDITCTGNSCPPEEIHFGGTIASPSTSVAHGYRKEIADWMKADIDIQTNLQSLKKSLRCVVGEWNYSNENSQLRNMRQMNKIYYDTIDNFAKSTESDQLECKKNIVFTMYSLANQMMNLLKTKNLDYSPYELLKTTDNINYHLPSNYKFFQNLSEELLGEED